MLIEIDGGAMIGYCATGRSGIASAPPRQISSAMTHAKMGRSMKKLGIAISASRQLCDDGWSSRAQLAAVHALTSSPPLDAVAIAASGSGSTTSPATNFWKPSTTTRSPGFTPSRISQ